MSVFEIDEGMVCTGLGTPEYFFKNCKSVDVCSVSIPVALNSSKGKTSSSFVGLKIENGSPDFILVGVDVNVFSLLQK